MNSRRKIVVWAITLFIPVAGVSAQQQAVSAADPDGRPPIRRSWFTDRRALAVGDVVTIMVDEFTLAQANSSEVAERRRGRNANFGIGAGSGTVIRTQNNIEDRMRGEASRRNRFSAEISARITEITPSGTVRIEGVKKIKIDKHEQEVTIRGWIRAQDVSVSNTVESWRIADAEILYTSNGELGNPRQGILGKILDIIIP